MAMSLWKRAVTFFGGSSKRSTSTTLSNPASWLIDALTGGRVSSSGARVSAASALEAPGIYSGVRVISEDLASLPFVSYERNGDDTKTAAPDWHLWPILYDGPNDEMDSMQFVETMTAWAILRPSAYAEIVRDGGGNVVAMWPIPPELVQPMRIDGELCYYITVPNSAGQLTPNVPLASNRASFKVLGMKRVFRLRGLSLDAVTGVSMITTQREAIGLTLALQEHAARFFGNGATPGGVMEHPETLSDDAYKRLLTAWEARHQGLENAHRLAILEEGMKWHETSMQNDKAQFLESRKMALRDNARALRVKPHKIGDLEDATFSNIEHESIDHVVSTIRPWAVRWERAVRMQLMTEQERPRYVCEFLLDALLRGDLASRYAAHAIGRQWGWLSADDVCKMENRNPLPDGQGKMYMVPMNMTTPAKMLAAPIPGTAPPAGDPEPGDDPSAPPKKPEKVPVRADRHLVAAAFSRVFEMAFRSIVGREARVLEKAAKAGALPRSTGGLYDEHASSVRETLRPAVEALGAMIEADPARVAAYPDLAATRHVRLAVADLEAVILANPQDCAPGIRELAAQWLETRAATLAAREVAHAIETLGA